MSLEIKNLSHKRKSRTILHALNLTIPQGEIFGIAGESGAGKSTLARLLALLEPPTTGKILLDGKPLDAHRIDREDRRNIQMVFQDPFAALNPIHSALYTVIEALRFGKGCTKQQALAAAAQILEQLGISKDLQQLLPRQLSGGQRQRVCLARSVALSPRVLILDEPLSALDSSIQAQIVSLLLDWHKTHGTTYILISHDLPLIQYLCKRVLILREGVCVEVGPVNEVFNSPKHPYTAELVAAAFGKLVPS